MNCQFAGKRMIYFPAGKQIQETRVSKGVSGEVAWQNPKKVFLEKYKTSQ